MKNIEPVHRVEYDAAVINIYHAAKGQGISRHQHAHSHLTMCHAGSVLLRKEGRELTITKDSQPVNLVGDEWHEIEAMENDTVFVNIFSEGKN
jgi:quercetin dioxygenase-like cupin family protein